jgi:hypothetical protein
VTTDPATGVPILGTPATVVAHRVLCSVCGESMLMPDEDYKEAMRLGAPIRHGHHGQPDAGPVMRRYEARVVIVRVDPGEEGEEDTFTELLGVTARGEAPSLTAAINGDLSDDLALKWVHVFEAADPLSVDLREKWQAAAKHAHLAETD